MATDAMSPPQGRSFNFGEALGEARAFLSMVVGHGSGLVLRLLILSLALLAAGEIFAVFYVYHTSYPGKLLEESSALQLADAQHMLSARVFTQDAVVAGEYCSVVVKGGKCPVASGSYYFTYDSGAGSQSLLENLGKNVPTGVDPQVQKQVARFLMTFVAPLLLLANIFGLIFVSKGGGSGSISDIVGFGSIGRRRKGMLLAGTGVTFDDVAGAEEAVAELKEVRDYLRDPDRYKSMGALPPKGVLLLGPPGCGKTLLARAVAGESNVPFFSMSGAEFVESLVGVGAARVRDLFRQAHEFAPAIIFIDELDAAARKRNVGGGSGGTDEREQTLNQMLVAMDGFEVSSGVVVMGATNRPDILDPALLRPGRFDRHVTVDEPDWHGRLAILGLHARKKPLAADVDIEYLAHRTPGFTGADLANVVNEAALLAIREGLPQVEMRHFTEAVQRVIAGPQRRGHLMTDHERSRLAFHESGHAVVSAALGRSTQVHRVSIVARGRGLGQAQLQTDADRVLFTRDDLLDQMTIAMAGGAAEELRFKEPSTTAENDIEKVTDLARQMIGRYGMSTVLGPVRYIAKDLDIFLGGESATVAVGSPKTLQEFDDEVRKLVDYSRKRALDILSNHQTDLDRLVAELLESETLEGDILERLLAPVGVIRAPRGPESKGPGAGRAAGTVARAAEAAEPVVVVAAVAEAVSPEPVAAAEPGPTARPRTPRAVSGGGAKPKAPSRRRPPAPPAG
ncbi:MAG TPA: ATP-dependent zinc metalloprotease FtsH [Candidatus Dormibacteraeota bacterium]|nr:ATP-dependent zinc metalloprotease FtsH [Candidatus Dormibacteraeota bacterium]